MEFFWVGVKSLEPAKGGIAINFFPKAQSDMSVAA